MTVNTRLVAARVNIPRRIKTRMTIHPMEVNRGVINDINLIIYIYYRLLVYHQTNVHYFIVTMTDTDKPLKDEHGLCNRDGKSTDKDTSNRNAERVPLKTLLGGLVIIDTDIDGDVDVYVTSPKKLRLQPIIVVAFISTFLLIIMPKNASCRCGPDQMWGRVYNICILLLLGTLIVLFCLTFLWILLITSIYSERVQWYNRERSSDDSK